MTQCTAKSKQSGERCRRAAMLGRSVCYNHGGRTPQGLALPQTKTGRYSKHLPTRMLANYEASKCDPDLLALQDEIALIDARLLDLLTRVDTGESGHVWKALGEQFRAFQQILAAGKIAESRVLLTQISSLVAAGAADQETWSDIRSVINQRMRLIESERKRLVDMQQMINSDQAMLMVRSLVASVREHVHDPAILGAIAADLERLSLARTD